MSYSPLTESSYPAETELPVAWHDSAPEKIRQFAAAGESTRMWRSWQAHLQRRKRPPSLMCLQGDKLCPLLWAVPDELSPGDEPQPTLAERIGRLLARNSRSARRWRELARTIEAWLDELDVVPTNVEQARDTLAVLHALPRLASLWDAATWFEALQTLLSTAREALGSSGSLNSLAWQLWSGELPLTFAYLFPEIEACRQLAEPAGQVLSRGMTELLDEVGLPRSLGLAEIPQLLACWTRCHALVEHVADGCWERSAQIRYRSLVRHLLQLMRDDQECLLVSHATKRMQLRELLAAAAAASNDRPLERMARAVLTGKPGRLARYDERQRPSFHDPVTRVGVLRTSWRRRAPRLAVRYQGRDCAIELYDGHETLLAGLVEAQVTWNGQRLSPTGDWEESLWETDADVDYLELELPLAEGVRLQRHLLLARDDRFLFWADAILAPSESHVAATIDARLILPLGEGIGFQGEAKTCEGWLVGRKPLGRVLPLALGEWRSERRGGTLSESGTTLELAQGCSSGRGLFLPLFVDLDRDRRGDPCTWRRLTVAEERQIVSSDVASGFRVQIGARQWIFYRSLVTGLSRTLIGHHLLHEFFAGRLTKSGRAEQLLAVESPWGSPE